MSATHHSAAHHHISPADIDPDLLACLEYLELPFADALQLALDHGLTRAELDLGIPMPTPPVALTTDCLSGQQVARMAAVAYGAADLGQRSVFLHQLNSLAALGLPAALRRAQVLARQHG